ncbi:MAG: amidohydrolase family protein, partial [Gemmatimonadaceae bacterium]|nr:amidohydrolase family protein [Gloeobacterales cyanobacterium ES-bin-141]
ARAIVDDSELFSMVTSGGAKLLGVPELGKLSVGGPADLLLLDRPEASNTVEALFTARPEHVRLVVVRGQPALVRPPFEQIKSRLQPVRIDGQVTWLTGPIASLLQRSRRLLGERLYFGQAIEPL